MNYNIPAIETLLKKGIPIGTVFDMIMVNPEKYCSKPLVKYILNNFENYQEQIANLFLKKGYSMHLRGTHILRELFTMGFPEYFIVKYIVYPLTYQFRTHLPFIDYIKPIDNFPIFPYSSSPIIEELQGPPRLYKGNLSLPVVRYAIPGGGTEYDETPMDMCGTFYYPEVKSDILLKFNTCLIVPNKIVAYSYLFKKNIDEIAPDFITLDEYSYYEEPMTLMAKRCGFGVYYINFDKKDLQATYNLIKLSLTKSFDEIYEMVMESRVSFTTQQYFEELIREIDNENITYIYNGEIQDKDLILFMVSYIKYQAIKMMLAGTWNWRVTVFLPYTRYDQLLCNKARQMNIDGILLVTENSTGIYRIRSEIVDSRSREESYANLRIKNDPIVLTRRKYEIQEIQL